MTIARRMIILLAVPLLVLVGLGVFVSMQLATIERQNRVIAETQIGSLSLLGNISRTFTELRVDARSYLLSQDKMERVKIQAAFDADKTAVFRLLSEYADTFVSDDRDRRLLDDFRNLSRDWIIAVQKVMSLADSGRREDAIQLLLGNDVQDLAGRLRGVSIEWINHNEKLATIAGKAAVESIEVSRRNMLIAVAVALALTGTLGFLTFRRIVNPIRALQVSVESIAGGDYAKEVPFTKASDETGALARSVDVLKQGAAAMEGQRWVKAHAAKLTGGLQGATSLEEFGQRLTSELVPVLGGGVAAFYLFEKNPERIRRIADYGLLEARPPRIRPSWARGWSASAPASGNRSLWRTCRRTIFASHRAWVEPRRFRPPPGR